MDRPPSTLQERSPDTQDQSLHDTKSASDLGTKSSPLQLDIVGDLGAVASSPGILDTKHQIVQFERSQHGSKITTWFETVASDQGIPNTICINCIQCPVEKTFIFTTTCFHRLVDFLFNMQLDATDKHRNVKQIEMYLAQIVSKTKAKELFDVITRFGDPKPFFKRASLKVFPWDTLGLALERVFHLYQWSSWNNGSEKIPVTVRQITSIGFRNRSSQSSNGTPKSRKAGLKRISVEKRVCKACDHCRSRRAKCDGARPCGRCKADKAICTFRPRRNLIPTEKHMRNACDHCGSKKAKCDGARPCGRCKADKAICTFRPRRNLKREVEMLEQENVNLVAGLRVLYKRLQSGQGWEGKPLADTGNGYPLTSDILDGLDDLKGDTGTSPEDSLQLFEDGVIETRRGEEEDSASKCSQQQHFNDVSDNTSMFDALPSGFNQANAQCANHGATK